MPLVYDELRRLARGSMGRERRDHTLQPTALVHEAFIRLVDQSRVDWRGRTHFRVVGARVMRRILVDYARGYGSAKRAAGGSGSRLASRSCAPPTPSWDS
jgi:RNA polymerase sigma factor (TIGR02999 family)